MSVTLNIDAYSSDIASIAAGATYTTDSSAIDVQDVEVMAVQVKGTGANASSAGNLVVQLVASLDNSNYDTTAFHTLTVAFSGSSEVRETNLVNVPGLRSIKVTSVQNTDATYAVTNVNVIIGKTVL